VRTQEINSEEIELKIISKTNNREPSLFVDGISLNEIQADAIALLVEKSYCITANEIDNYCKLNGIFKNQLIDSINEICYEVIDDVLIEEDSGTYTLNENYYQKMLKL
jgi:hypothetical protein